MNEHVWGPVRGSTVGATAMLLCNGLSGTDEALFLLQQQHFENCCHVEYTSQPLSQREYEVKGQHIRSRDKLVS